MFCQPALAFVVLLRQRNPSSKDWRMQKSRRVPPAAFLHFQLSTSYRVVRGWYLSPFVCVCIWASVQETFTWNSVTRWKQLHPSIPSTHLDCALNMKERLEAHMTSAYMSFLLPPAVIHTIEPPFSEAIFAGSKEGCPGSASAAYL